MSAVRATNRARDAADEAEQRRTERKQALDKPTRERLETLAQDLYARTDATSKHASRALASYAAVAGNDERSQLNNLLGFDAYA